MMAPQEVLSKSHQGEEQEEGKTGGDGGKREWRLSEVDTRAVSRRQNGLIDEFKMAASDVISIGGRI